MVTKKHIFCIGLLVILNTLNAQENGTATNNTTRQIPVIHFSEQLINDTFYTGIDGRFVMSFASDSIVQARFFREDMFDRYQKIRYRRSGDTIFLHNSSQPRVPYSLCKQEQIQDMEEMIGDPVMVRFFSPKQSNGRGVVQEHRFLHEEVYYMDTISLQLLIPYKEYLIAGIPI